MNRYLSSFLLTLGLYMGLFAVVLFSWDKKVEFTDKTLEAKRIEVSLVSLPKPAPAKPAPITPPVEEQPNPKEEPKKEEPKKVEKVEEVIPKPLPKIEPTAKKIVKKKPVKKIVKKIKKKETKKVVKKQRNSNPKNAQKSIITKNSKNSSKALAQKRNLYFANLKRKINRNKSYPRIAKRRGMQGSVKVRFMISSSGKLLNIKILSGPKVFHSSTKSAIKRSLPYAPPKGVLKSNTPLTISVDYKLI
ncbi:MAG: TonB family protein [Campylobacterota bacterium]|nr:TonB family protein [Campylobacterota bacterium]